MMTSVPRDFLKCRKMLLKSNVNDKTAEMDRTMPSPLRMTRAAPWLSSRHALLNVK